MFHEVEEIIPGRTADLHLLLTPWSAVTDSTAVSHVLLVRAFRSSFAVVNTSDVTP